MYEYFLVEANNKRSLTLFRPIFCRYRQILRSAIINESENRSVVLLQLFFKFGLLSSEPCIEFGVKGRTMIHVERMRELVKENQPLQMHRQEQREERKIDVMKLLGFQESSLLVKRATPPSPLAAIDLYLIQLDAVTVGIRQ